MRKKVIENIQGKIRLLNHIVIVTFVVFVLLFLIVRFLYYSWDFITNPSIVAMLSIIAFISIIGLYLSNKVSKQASNEIEDYSSKLDNMLNLTLDIREEKYGDILLEKILGHALAITDANAGSIMLLDKDRLVFKSVKGPESKKLLGVSISKTEGIAGWVVQKGEPLIVNDVKQDDRFNPEIDRLTGYNTKSILCAPLKLSTGVLGAIELLNKNSNSFTQKDAEVITYFADQATIAIDRANFYEDQKNFEIHLTDILLSAIDNSLKRRGHSRRVAKYSLLISHAMNMSESEKKRLYTACLFHDVGFLNIFRQEIKSRDDYKTHCQYAYEMLRPINFYADIVPIVLHHHERYDGEGYPSGLKGEDIPIESRIIAIAEAFDVMVDRGSYKYTGKMIDDTRESFLVRFNDAIEELKKNAGSQFDPQLVNIFINIVTPEHLN
ncbi:MAG: HD domain-containing protein [Nitrospira sp.]|nr:HD domain-containing protein [Nitrospira sp.]